MFSWDIFFFLNTYAQDKLLAEVSMYYECKSEFVCLLHLHDWIMTLFLMNFGIEVPKCDPDFIT